MRDNVSTVLGALDIDQLTWVHEWRLHPNGDFVFEKNQDGYGYRLITHTNIIQYLGFPDCWAYSVSSGAEPRGAEAQFEDCTTAPSTPCRSTLS